MQRAAAVQHAQQGLHHLRHRADVLGLAGDALPYVPSSEVLAGRAHKTWHTGGTADHSSAVSSSTNTAAFTSIAGSTVHFVLGWVGDSGVRHLGIYMAVAVTRQRR